VGRRREAATVAVIVAAFGLLAAWRATFGITFIDDAHYAVVTLRLAQGARVFADEMTSQALGFLPAVPFARLWTALFGTSGIVLALRLFYVALAIAVGYVIYRCLRPSFGALAAALAAWLPLLAPPYNIIGTSYNTSAILAFSAAVALCFAALRDDDRAKAAAAGVATFIGAFSYPPLSAGALVFAITFVLVARDRRLIGWFILGGAAALLVAAAWLAVTVSVHDIRQALAYSSQVWRSDRPPLQRASSDLRHLRRSLTRDWVLPMWVLVVLGCLPWIRPRWRALVLALVPLAAFRQAIPDALSRGQRDLWLGIGTAWLTLSTLGLLPAVIVRVARGRHPDLRRLLLLAAPMALLDWMIVAVMTRSGWGWAVAYTGLAPLTVVVVAAWMSILTDDGGRWLPTAAAVGVAFVAVFMLWTVSFKEGPPLRLAHRFTSGPLAGIATSEERAAEITAVETQARKWVRPGDRVLVFNAPLAYLLARGEITTNAAWLARGPSDRYTVEYFDRHSWPDVAFVSQGLLEPTAPADPLVEALRRAYRVVDSSTRLVVLVRR
jgi:4-amino-4-deoxy-L-arabinose transferase-like glycosyltransferase